VKPDIADRSIKKLRHLPHREADDFGVDAHIKLQ
jgi:hypothetical protein